MAVDTKPNLSNSKFEQCVGDTLTLSGITNVHGTFSVRSGATLSILPNRGSGKVLTSDANGVGTWQIGGTVGGADNGLTLAGNKIILGGALTGNTDIGLSTNILNFCSTNSSYCFNNLCSILAANIDNYINLHGDSNDGSAMSLVVNNKCVDINDCFDWVRLQNTNSSIDVCSVEVHLNANNTACVDIDGLNDKVLITATCAASYAADYCTVFDSVPRSIPDAAWVLSKTSSSSSGERITKLINQPSHGFTVGTVLGWSGGTYNKPIANGLYDGEILGIVSKCYNANCFDLTQAGYVTGLTSLTANTTYFLSDSTAGLLTCLEPTINGCIAKTMLIADSTTSAWVLPYAGYVVTTGSSGGGTVTGALNGLTLSGSDIILGGSLDGNTAICLNNNTINIGCNTEPAYLEIDGVIKYAYLNATTISYLNIYGGTGNENANLHATTTSYLNICGATGNEYICLLSVNSSLNLGGAGGANCLHLQANASYLDIYGDTGSELIALNANSISHLTIDGSTGNESAKLHANANSFLDICSISTCITAKLSVNVATYFDICGISTCELIYLQPNNSSYLSIDGTTGIESIVLYMCGTNLQMSTIGGNIFTDAQLKGLEYSTDYSSSFTNNSLVSKQYVDDRVSSSAVTFTNGLTNTSSIVCLGGTLTEITTTIGLGGNSLAITDTDTNYSFALGQVYLCPTTAACLYVSADNAKLYANATSYLDICGVSGSESACLYANTNSYLIINGVSGSEYAYLHANTNSYLDIDGASGSEYISLQSGSGTYMNMDGAVATKSIEITAYNDSWLCICGASGSELVNLYSNFTNGTFLNLGGIGGCQSACLSASPTSYLDIYGVSGSESICLQSDPNTYLFLSGGTASILGNTKLLTTPATGVCTDSVLAWNSVDKTIKILPYSSGGTGGSSLSEFTITGNSSATGFTINHAKNKQFVGVEVVRNSSPYPTVYTNVYRTNANCVCVTFDTAPTTGLEYKILIIS
jgi:hypothetical protein